MSLSDDYRLILVDTASGSEIAELTEITSFIAKPKFNAVGTWTLVVSSNMREASLLTLTGISIVLRRTNAGTGFEDIFSGYVTKYKEKWDGNKTVITVSGSSDIEKLLYYYTIPEPATLTPQYTTDLYYTITDIASTVLYDAVNKHAGPSARMRRILPGLSLDTDLVFGDTITLTSRWEQLLVVLQREAIKGGELGFDLLNGVFSVYQPEDKSTSVVFSQTLKNLKSYELVMTLPGANYMFTGGGEEGLSRIFAEDEDSQSIIDYGYREGFLNFPNSILTAELHVEGQAELVIKQGQVTVKLEPNESTDILYQRDYRLGDKIGARISDVDIEEIIREVEISITKDKGVVIKPLLGTSKASITPALTKALRGSAENFEGRFQIIEGR